MAAAACKALMPRESMALRSAPDFAPRCIRVSAGFEQRHYGFRMRAQSGREQRRVAAGIAGFEACSLGRKHRQYLSVSSSGRGY